MTAAPATYSDHDYYAARGTHNVVLRIEHLWSQHRTGRAPCNQIARDWELARSQIQATWLTPEIESTILRWALAEGSQHS